MGNPFVYVQLQTQDLSKAKDFYRELFDWTYDERQTPAGPYVEVDVGDDKGGGMVGHRDPAAPSRWVPYVLVTDIGATADKARALGATVLMGPADLPDKSRFCLLLDVTGAAFALHQSAPG
jgi:predicted enzyme related to lactoylglutathione lyase